MNEERRRFFRINETVGLSIHFLDESGEPISAANIDSDAQSIALISKQDERIERLLLDLQETHPKMAELAGASWT